MTSIRRKIGLDKSGGVPKINKSELVISKPVNIVELSKRVSRHIKPGTKSVDNVDEYYQAARKANA